MNKNFVRILGVMLAIFMVVTMLPTISLASVTVADSPNYFEVVTSDGSIKQYLYNDTITDGGKTLIGLIGAYNVGGNAAAATGRIGAHFDSVQSSGVDYEGGALPTDSNWYVRTNILKEWNNYKYDEIHSKYMSWIPTTMQSYLVKYSYDCGVNTMYDNYKSHTLRTVAKLTIVSKDEVTAHKDYLISAVGTNNRAIATRTGNGGSGFYEYIIADGDFVARANYQSPNGAIFFRTYADENMFKSVKLNTETLGSNIKNLILNSFTLDEMVETNLYTADELENIGYSIDRTVTNVTLDKSNDEVGIDGTINLVATVEPAYASNKNILWSSSDPSIATVNNGVVTGVSAGTVTITAASEEDDTIKATCIVNVVVEPVTGVELNKNSTLIYEGDAETLIVNVIPDVAYNKNVVWSTTNPEVATVNNGVVTAIDVGEAIIAVTTVDGGFTDECVVTVKSKAVTSVTLNKDAISIFAGKTDTLDFVIEPSVAINKNVTWSTSDETVATIVDGVVTGVMPGIAEITVTTEDGGFTDTCVVTVNAVNVTNIALDKTSLVMAKGGTFTVNATITPADATYKTVEWTSSNEEVATVADGVITAVDSGNAVITAKTVDGDFTAVVNVKVIGSVADSSNYIKIVNPADGKITEFLYNDTITVGEKTYIGLIGTLNVGGNTGTTGRTGAHFDSVQSGGVDFEGEALPSDTNWYVGTNILKEWNNYKFDEIHGTYMFWIPTVMHNYLLKYSYDCGTNTMYDGNKSHTLRTMAKLTIVSKDEVEKHKDFLTVATGGSTNIATRTGNGGSGYYEYNITDGNFVSRANFVSPNGALFFRMYVDADMFATVKMDVDTMGDDVKSALVSSISMHELKKAGYTSAELESIGYPDEYELFATIPAPVSGTNSLAYTIKNNGIDSISFPVILTVAYDANGKIVGANHAIASESVKIDVNKSKSGNMEFVTSEKPAYVVCYALKSINDMTPLAKCVAYEGNMPDFAVTEYDKQPVNAKYAVEYDGDVVKSVKFTVSGSIADKATYEALTLITKPGKSVADLATDKTTDVLLYVNESKIAENGTYGHVFTVPATELAYKKYDASTWVDGKENKISFTYTDKQFDKQVASAVADVVSSGTAAKLDSFVSAYKDILAIDVTLYGKLDGSSKAAAAKALDTNLTISNDIVADLNKQVAAQLVSQATIADGAKKAIADYNKYLGLDLADWVDKKDADGIDVLPATQKDQVYGLIADGTFADAGILEKEYQGAVLVVRINNRAYYKDIQPILAEHKAEVKALGIDIDNYANFDAIVQTITSDTFASWADFKGQFEYAAANYSGGDGGSGGGSGGGGGGGLGGGKTPTSDTLVQFGPDITETVVPSTPKYMFADLGQAEWAVTYVEALAKLGHINGKGNNTFCPNDSIKREEVVKILVSALGLDVSAADASFTDVDADAWYAPYIAAAKANGIVNGKPDGSFGIGAEITREELATMIYRAAGLLASETDVEFADEAEIADYAKEAVSTLVATGVLNGKGDNKFAPKANATRAEASKIIYLAVIGK